MHDLSGPCAKCEANADLAPALYHRVIQHSVETDAGEHLGGEAAGATRSKPARETAEQRIDLLVAMWRVRWQWRRYSRGAVRTDYTAHLDRSQCCLERIFPRLLLTPYPENIILG